MNLLLALIQYLVDNSICAGDGIDCFRDFVPEEPIEMVSFVEYAGDPVSAFMDAVHRSVQVRVRTADAESANAKAWAVCKAFRASHEDLRINFSDDLWGQVYVRQTPFKLLQDKSNSTTYCFNLGITTNILD